MNGSTMAEGIHQGDMYCTLRNKACHSHVETLYVANLLSLEKCLTAQMLVMEEGLDCANQG